MRSDKRNKGAGTLEKRHGVWLARWVVDGKRFARSTGTGNRREAERILDEITAPFRLGTKKSVLLGLKAQIGGVEDEIEQMRASRPGVSIAEAWDVYLKAPERPGTTSATGLTAYRARWLLFVDFMRRRYPHVTHLRQVGREHVVAWLPELEKGRAPGTFNVIIRLCKSMWRVLAKNADNNLPPEHSPFECVMPRRTKAVPRRVLTSDELFHIMRHLEGKGELRTLFLIGIYTGLRLGDAATLKWENVDMGLRKIELTPRKTSRVGTTVRMAIHPALFAELVQTPVALRTGYVLPETGAEYDASECGQKIIQHRTTDVFEACGIETRVDAGDGGHRRSVAGFHSLRHSFVSLQINAGIPAPLVQRMVGHTSIAMTGHYFHEDDASLRAAVAALPDVTGAAVRQADGSAGVRWADFVALVEKMSQDERRRAVDYLTGKTGGEVIDVEPEKPEPVKAEAQPERTTVAA